MGMVLFQPYRWYSCHLVQLPKEKREREEKDTLMIVYLIGQQETSQVKQINIPIVILIYLLQLLQKFLSDLLSYNTSSTGKSFLGILLIDTLLIGLAREGTEMTRIKMQRVAVNFILGLLIFQHVTSRQRYM